MTKNEFCDLMAARSQRLAERCALYAEMLERLPARTPRQESELLLYLIRGSLAEDEADFWTAQKVEGA